MTLATTSTPSAAPPEPQVRPLTSIRGFAALWVLALHFDTEFTALFPPLKHLHWLSHGGSAGVDLFFVLSGFILCRTYLPRFPRWSWPRYREFLWMRLARIYPAYLVAVLAVIGMVAVARGLGLPFSAKNYSAQVLPWEFLLVHAWSCPSCLMGWNSVDWSVSAEWFAYLLVFPVTFALLIRVQSIGGRLVLAALAALGAGLIHSAFVPVATVTVEFILGGLLYSLTRSWRNVPAWLPDTLLVGALGLLLVLVRWPTAGTRGGLVVCFAVLIGALSYDRGRLARFLSRGVFVYLGTISYSLYLTHQLVQRAFKVLLHPERFDPLPALTKAGYGAIYLGALLGAAALLYHLVEEPGRRLLRKVWEKRRAARAA